MPVRHAPGVSLRRRASTYAAALPGAAALCDIKGVQDHVMGFGLWRSDWRGSVASNRQLQLGRLRLRYGAGMWWGTRDPVVRVGPGRLWSAVRLRCGGVCPDAPGALL
jgi:hypothetical protein